MKSRFFQIIAFIFVLFLLYLYNRAEMFSDDIYEDTGLISHSLVVLCLLLFCVAYSWKSIYKPEQIGLSRTFTSQMICMYLFAILVSVIIPFPAKEFYFSIILPLAMFYFAYSITIELDNNRIVLLGYIVLIVALGVFYLLNFQNNVVREMYEVNNASYTILFFLPFILCLRNNVAKVLLSSFVILIVLTSLKRGGFFAVLFGLAIYLLITNFSISDRKFNIWGGIVIIIIVAAVYELILNFDSSTGGLLTGRLNDMGDSQGSGRINIYKEKISLIFNSSPLGFVFGHGWRATEVDGAIKLTAHNDFLEIFYDFGLIGFVLFIRVLVSLIQLNKQLINEKSRLAAPLGASIAILFVNLMVAHIWIYSRYLTTFALFWGFVVAAKNFDYFKNEVQI